MPEMVIGKVFRFVATGGGSRTISAVELLDLVFMATGATAGSRLFQSVRLNAVEIWGPPSATLTPVTVSLEWVSDATTFGAPTVQQFDSSVGSTRPAHVISRPPARSLAAMWLSNSATANLFSVAVPAGGTIDVHLTYVLRANESTGTAVTAAVAGATAGVVYARRLDSTNASPILGVVGWVTA